jgi:hypothetical protein
MPRCPMRPASPHRSAGVAYYFARGKLRADPVYRAILELGVLLGRAQVLDLGCGAPNDRIRAAV